MGDRYDVFLEIQRGGWDSQRARQKQDAKIKQFTKYASASDLLKVYGAGWLREPGLAFGKNPPFLPNGSVFKRIVHGDVGNGDLFGVDDLYATYILKEAADKYGFGRGAEKQSRRQTRYLFYMVTTDVLKDVLSRAGMPVTNHDLSVALIKLDQTGNETEKELLFDTACEVIDSYLTPDTDDSVFREAAFKNTFNQDLNGFLKWEQLGRSLEKTPCLQAQFSSTKKSMGRRGKNEPSPRDVITKTLLDSGVDVVRGAQVRRSRRDAESD